MKVGENPLYTMLARYPKLATEVVLEPMAPFSNYWCHEQFKLESTQTDKMLPPIITMANKPTTLY